MKGRKWNRRKKIICKKHNDYYHHHHQLPIGELHSQAGNTFNFLAFTDILKV
jgi:hypothetical protein